MTTKQLKKREPAPLTMTELREKFATALRPMPPLERRHLLADAKELIPEIHGELVAVCNQITMEENARADEAAARAAAERSKAIRVKELAKREEARRPVGLTTEQMAATLAALDGPRRLHRLNAMSPDVAMDVRVELATKYGMPNHVSLLRTPPVTKERRR